MSLFRVDIMIMEGTDQNNSKTFIRALEDGHQGLQSVHLIK